MFNKKPTQKEVEKQLKEVTEQIKFQKNVLIKLKEKRERLITYNVNQTEIPFP